VVNANTTGIITALEAIQGSMQQLNETSNLTREEISGMRSDVGDLLKQVGTQSTEISYVRRDLGRVEKAVQSAGIQIPVMNSDGGMEFKPGSWDDLRAAYGIDDSSPIFITVTPDRQ
jgi:hypothetical protein